MAAPTRVTGVSVVLSTATTPKTTSALNLTVGDILVVCAGAGGPSSGMGTNPSVSAGAVTWTLRQSVAVSGFGDLKLWTGVVTTASASATVSLTCTGGLSWGFVVEQYANGAVVGTSAVNHASTGNPTITLTTGVANSAIVSGSTDFNGTTGTITWSTVNGSAETAQATVQTASDYGAYYGFVPDAGTAGSKTVGVTAPTGQVWAAAAVEIQGASGTNYTPSGADTGAGSDSAAVVMAVVEAVADTGAGSDAATTNADNVRSSADTGSGADTATTVSAISQAPADTGTGTDAAGSIQANVRTVSDTGSGSDSATFVQNQSLAAADTGSGSDSAVASFILIQNGADTGSGADSIAVLLNMAPTYSDTASGSDSAQIQRSVFTGVQDTGTGTDAESHVQSQVQSLTDTGSGSDAIQALVTIARTAADTGAGSDVITTQADNVRSTADTGSGSDAIATAAAYIRALADTGTGTDTFTTLLGMVRSGTDTGTGTDAYSFVHDIVTTYRDLALAAVALPTRWAVAEIVTRWASVSNGNRWATSALERWTWTPLPARFAVTLNAGDTMATDVIISAGAAKYVGGTITETTGKDISADTFQISLGSDVNPGTWLTPDISAVGTTNAQRIVKLLVSSTVPTGLVKGTYWVWVRITDSPEIEPLRVQGPVNVR